MKLLLVATPVVLAITLTISSRARAECDGPGVETPKVYEGVTYWCCGVNVRWDPRASYPRCVCEVGYARGVDGGACTECKTGFVENAAGSCECPSGKVLHDESCVDRCDPVRGDARPAICACEDAPGSLDCICALNPDGEECLCGRSPTSEACFCARYPEEPRCLCKDINNVDFSACTRDACGTRSAACTCCDTTETNQLGKAIHIMALCTTMTRKFSVRACNEGLIPGTNPKECSCLGTISTGDSTCSKCVDCYMYGKGGTTVTITAELTSVIKLKIYEFLGLDIGAKGGLSQSTSHPSFPGYNAFCKSFADDIIASIVEQGFSCELAASCSPPLRIIW